MPRLSSFYGIALYMYVRDDGVAHFHARYGDDEAVIEAASGTVPRGGLPRRQAKLVQEWAGIHRVRTAGCVGQGPQRGAAGYDRAAAMTSRERTPAVVGVAVIRPHVMRLLFDDGVVRDVQYVPGEGRGSLLGPLEDPEYFAQVRVDDEARTVVWANGLDLAPEVLHGDFDAENGLGFHDVTSHQLA